MGQGGPQGQNSTLGGNPTQGNSTPAAQAGVTRTPAPTYSASAPPASPGGKGGFPGGPASAPPASAPSFSSTPAAQAGVTRTPAPTYSASAPPASPGGKGGFPGGPASAPPASAPSFSSAPAPSPYAAALQAAISGYMPRSPGGAPPPMAPPPMAPPPMVSPQGQQQPFQPPRVEAVSNFDARNARIKKARDDQAAQRAGLAVAFNNINGFNP